MFRRNWIWTVPAALAFTISSACSEGGGNTSPEADAVVAAFVAGYAASVDFFCECGVANGTFDTLAECTATYPFFGEEDCLRRVVTEFPGLLERAECAVAVTADLATCTEAAVCNLDSAPNDEAVFAEFTACYATWGIVDLANCPEPPVISDAWFSCFSGADREPSI
jgi:hypothetical protein